jgi:FAD/FMN-containing dehydrogenase
MEIDRRAFLKLGAVGALALAGCSPKRHPKPPPPPSSAPTTSTSTTAPSATPDWRQLRAGLIGRLVLPGDGSYPQDLQLYDSRYDSVRPAGIVFCAAAADMQKSLAFARQYHLPFAVRGGGHSYAGYSTTSGLVIDVTTINQIEVNGSSATIGAGARLIDVYSSLNNRGVSIPGGSCPTVGIAGLTLGGGAGVVDRLYGLTCDSLTSLQIVTADGQLVTADPVTNSDLFWACRGGGGGNFGIVTSLSFTTFPTQNVALFTMGWPWAAAADVLAAWFKWAPPAPDSLWSNLLLQVKPPARDPLVEVNGVWVGSQAGAAGLLDQLAGAVGSTPSQRFLGTSSFGHAMYVEGGCGSLSQNACHLPGQAPGGTLMRQPSLAKSDYLNAPLTAQGIAAVLAGLNERQAAGAQGAVGYDPYGGAINRVAADATAFVHRNALCSAQYNFPFNVGDPASVIASGQTWLNQWYRSLRPYVSGYAYQNYIDPDLADWAHAYYGTNLPRLQQVKRAWDPDNVFHFAQSIPLA